MLFLIKVAFWVSVVLLTLSYLILAPYPAGTKRVFARSVRNLVARIIGLTARLGARLGIDTAINLQRRIQRSMFAIQTDNKNVRIHNTKLGGVGVRIYRPVGNDSLMPGMVFYHGGGWVFGSTGSYDNLCVAVTLDLPCVVVSIDYRLAPEHPYPAAFDDCFEATKVLLQSAERYGIAKDKIGIAGDSAGGNLAAAVALKLTTEEHSSLPQIKYQGLLYPALQAFDFSTPSYLKYANGPFVLTKNFMIFFWLCYLKGNAENLLDFAENRHIPKDITSSNYAKYFDCTRLPWFSTATKSQVAGKSGGVSFIEETKTSVEETNTILDPYFSPLLASDDALKRLPPTYIISSEIDVLRDDGFLFANRLKDLEKEVVLDYVASEEHGFMYNIRGNEDAAKSLKKFLEFVRDKLKNEQAD